MPDDWTPLPTRRVPVDALPPKALRGLDALVTAGIPVAFLSLTALFGWLDNHSTEHGMGRGSAWMPASIAFFTLFVVTVPIGIQTALSRRKTWLGKISLAILFVAILVAVDLVRIDFQQSPR